MFFLYVRLFALNPSFPSSFYYSMLRINSEPSMMFGFPSKMHTHMEAPHIQINNKISEKKINWVD